MTTPTADPQFLMKLASAFEAMRGEAHEHPADTRSMLDVLSELARAGAPAPASFKVGDRVRVVGKHLGNDGKVGEVIRRHGERCGMYMVLVGPDEVWYWPHELAPADAQDGAGLTEEEREEIALINDASVLEVIADHLEQDDGAADSHIRILRSTASRIRSHLAAPKRDDVEALRAELDEWKQRAERYAKDAAGAEKERDSLRAEVERLTKERDAAVRELDESDRGTAWRKLVTDCGDLRTKLAACEKERDEARASLDGALRTLDAQVATARQSAGLRAGLEAAAEWIVRDGMPLYLNATYDRLRGRPVFASLSRGELRTAISIAHHDVADQLRAYAATLPASPPPVVPKPSPITHALIAELRALRCPDGADHSTKHIIADRLEAALEKK
jgi:predicted  nucleic acid-binding Zn-ribbon protein